MRILYNVFDSYHPVSGFFYFCMVILVPVCWMHPLLLAVSAVAAVSYALFLRGWRQIWKQLLFGLGLLVFLTLVNALFNHRGITVLFYLGDNPVTMESVVYGLCSALMIFSIIVWFLSFNEIMRPDKFLFLFGRVSPSIALVLSMTLRFVPLLKQRYDRIDAAQKCFGGDDGGKGWVRRMKTAAKKLSALISQSLEGAVITADSMKARGYGKRRRSCFSIFSFTAADGFFCAFLGLACTAMGVLLALGGASAGYFPVFHADMGAGSLLVCALYAILSFSPMILEGVEWLRWSFIR